MLAVYLCIVFSEIKSEHGIDFVRNFFLNKENFGKALLIEIAKRTELAVWNQNYKILDYSWKPVLWVTLYK